jgi:hypothetical protein
MRDTTSTAAERGKVFFHKFVVPAIEFVCALGSQVFLYTGTIGRIHSANGVLCIGVSPASNLTTNLPQSVVTSFDKVFVENLKAHTPWVRCTSRRQLDENSGNKLALFMYQNLPAPPLTQAPEGTIQTGLTVSVTQNTSTMGNYADYANISTYALQTAIDPALEALGVQMAYRLAQVVNLIIQNTADGAAAVDPLVDALSLTGNQTLQTTDITALAQSLQGVNALPMENGRYMGVMHPFTAGDVLSDQANNSLVDVVKRTAEGNERLKELPSSDGDLLSVLDWGGVTFFQSTLVHQTPDYDSTTDTAFRTYVIGKDGVIGVSFGAKENTQIGDGDWRNMNIWVRRLTEPSGYDPSRMIGGFASYNTMYTASLPPDTIMRIRYIDAVSAIS